MNTSKDSNNPLRSGEFSAYLVRSDKLTLVAALEWIRKNMTPEEVFPELKRVEEDEY